MESYLQCISILCSDTILGQESLIYGEGDDIEISIICITTHDTQVEADPILSPEGHRNLMNFLNKSNPFLSDLLSSV